MCRAGSARPSFRGPGAGLGAVLPLLMPVMLFAGILTGVATPTEVSSFAVVYGLFLAIVLYREMDLKSFARTVIDSATLTGLVLFILAAASSFSFSLTIAYVPQRLVELLHTINDNTTLFLLGSILLLIVVGSCLLEGLPALNVLAPLLLPIAGKIGISELHYGILLIIAMGIGAFIPPAGVGFYVCCAVMRTDIEAATRVMAPCICYGALDRPPHRDLRALVHAGAAERLRIPLIAALKEEIMTETELTIDERLAAYRRLFDLFGQNGPRAGCRLRHRQGLGRGARRPGCYRHMRRQGQGGGGGDRSRPRARRAAPRPMWWTRATPKTLRYRGGRRARPRAARHRADAPALHVRKPMLDYTDEEYDRVAELNLRGTFYFLRAFGRLMTKAGWGSLIASSAGRATTLEPGLAIYGATKAGIIQMVRGLASEVGRFGVRVNAIVPSIVETPLVAPLKARPEIFAEARRPHGVRALEPAERGGGRRRLPRLGRRQLHHRHRLPRRRRLDRDRRPAVRPDRDPPRLRRFRVKDALENK